MLNNRECRYNVTDRARRGWRVMAAILGIAVVACSDTSGPPQPGAIRVTAATSGFLKPDSIALVVDGVSKGTLAVTDSMTIPGLEPGSHLVGLADLPANCSSEGANVAVVSNQTANVSVVINCAFAAPVAVTVQFTRQRPDLDTGQITTCPFGVCATQENWDFWVQNNLNTTPHSVIRQNQTTGVEIAHLPGVSLSALTEAAVSGATFTTQLVNDPFDAARVILIRTDQGNVYALGNPVEDLTNGRLTFDAALVARP